MDWKKTFDKWLMKEFTHDYHVYTKDFKAPDWRKYKVSDSKLLMQTAEALKFHGLKDPWARNEVWRFTRTQNNTFQNIKMFIFRGWKSGIAVGIAYHLIESTINPPVDHHH